MKRIFGLWVFALGVMALVSACSNDDDKNKNANGPGNGGSGVDVLSKKVVKLIELEKGETRGDTTFFNYDGEGRLTKMINNYNQEINIRYADNQITVVSGGDSDTYGLSDGNLTSFKKGEGFVVSNDFSYAGGYLSQYIRKEMEGSKMKENDVFSYTLEGGNLKAMEDIYTYEDSKPDTYHYTFEYGKVANNANIDLWGILYDEDYIEEFRGLCVLGKRYRNLPAKYTCNYKINNRETTYTCSYDYEVDKEGYVTKITETYTEVGSTEEPDVTVYTIFYE